MGFEQINELLCYQRLLSAFSFPLVVASGIDIENVIREVVDSSAQCLSVVDVAFLLYPASDVIQVQQTLLHLLIVHLHQRMVIVESQSFDVECDARHVHPEVAA